MTPILVRGILFNLLLFSLGCKSTFFLPFKSKSEIKKEYSNDMYHNVGNDVEFKKGNWFFFLSKKEAKKASETELYSDLKKIKKNLTPIYAGQSKNAENLPEFIFVFKIKNLTAVDSFLKNFTPISKFLYNTEYNYKVSADRIAKYFFKNNPHKKNIVALALVTTTDPSNSYLISYTTEYKDTVNFFRNFYNWDKQRQEGYKYSDAINKYGIDTVMQIQGFGALRYIIRTINEKGNNATYNFFSKINTTFKSENTNSYYNSVEKINKLYSDKLTEPESNTLLQEYYQCKATYLSFASQHDKAMECNSEYEKTDNTFSIPGGYQVSNAINDVLENVKEKKIIAFNESHHDVRCRAFVFSLLDSLKKIGFTHLAIEDLQELPNETLTFNSGFYCREPLFCNLILYARQIGFKFIAYDLSLVGKVSAQKREMEAARNILKKIHFKKNEKLIILCGYGHTDKGKSNSEPASLMDYLKKYSGIEPFTIDLAYSRLYYLKDTVVSQYYTLKNIQQTNSFYNKFGNGDISVYPPNAIPYFDYNFSYKNKLLPLLKSEIDFIPRSNKKEEGTLTVYLYKSTGGDFLHKNEIPLFTGFIKNTEQKITIFTLLSGNYDLMIKDSNNAVIVKKNLTF